MGGDKQEFMLKVHESSLAIPINRYALDTDAAELFDI